MTRTGVAGGVWVSPRDDPTAYPGTVPAGSFLLDGDAVEPLDRQTLAERLSALGVPAMTERTAVLAYGSNAAPAHLAGKLVGAGEGQVVPVVAALARDVEVVYSAHITRYGSMPGTLAHAVGARIRVHVLFLDDAQRAIVDRTEPNYDVVTVGAVTSEDGERLDGVVGYRSRHGETVFDGSPNRLAEVPSEAAHHPARTQLEALRWFSERFWPLEGGFSAGRWRAFVSGEAFDSAELTRRLRRGIPQVDTPGGPG